MQRTIIPDSFEINGRTFSGFHALPVYEAERLYIGLVKHGRSCGCNEGAIGVLLSVCIYLLDSIIHPIPLTESVIATWQLGVVTAIAGGIVGKCVGLLWAHRTYKKLQQEFDLLLENQPKTNDRSTRSHQKTG